MLCNIPHVSHSGGGESIEDSPTKDQEQGEPTTSQCKQPFFNAIEPWHIVLSSERSYRFTAQSMKVGLSSGSIVTA